MPIPILITKVVLPAWREEILSRKRLISLFDHLLDSKLIIVSAPAGYGKTSLLLDIAHHGELPFCWYTLDSLDQETNRFLAHFTTAIARRFPSFGKQSLSVLKEIDQGNINVEEICIVIVNEIYQTIREHFVIVLDDYQMVDENQLINTFINRFIQYVDQNCHLVITSRSALPLPDISLMVGRSMVGGLGLPELAFQPDEIQALMLKNYQQVVPDSIAIELAQRTDGWITGLLLSAQSMWQGMVNQLRLARVSGVDLYEYLVEQVLNQQPQVLRDFLLQTSFLDEFNAELCSIIFGDPPEGYSWQTLLDIVQRHNLFISPVGESGEWLHYHRLFSDFLQAQYMREHPNKVNILLNRLVTIYADREEWEKAYSFCLRIGNPEISAALIEQAGQSMVVNGRITLLRTWLEALPVNLIQERPILLARYGIVLATQKETNRGLQMLEQSVTLFRKDNSQSHLAGTLVWRALSHYLRAEYPQALADVDEVFSLTSNMSLNDELAGFQAEAHRIGGQCYRMMGNMPAASNGLKNALQIFRTLGDQSGINRVLLLLGLLNLDSGNFTNAMICYQQVLDYYQIHQDAFSSSSVLNDIACIHYLKGEYIEAFVTFNDALAKARKSGNSRVEGLVLLGLGDVFTDLTEYSEAIKTYDQGQLIVENIKEKSLLIYVHLAKAAVERSKGDFTRAYMHLKSANSLIKETKAEYSRGQYLLQTGLIEFANKDYAQAIKTLADANVLFIAGEQRIDEIRCNCFLAVLQFEINNNEQAYEYLEHASQLAAELDGRNILIQAARQVKGTLIRMTASKAFSLPAIHLIDEVSAFEADLPRMKNKLRAQETAVFIPPPQLCIQGFGQIQVKLDERPVSGAEWQVMVTRDLLYLILSNRKGLNKEQIGEYLWPESSPAQLNQRFKNTVYRLRRALNQDVIQYRDGIYTFNRKIDYRYDVEQFEDRLALARKAGKVEEQIDIYQSVVDLYCGEYLPGMDEEWVISERERLLQLFLKAGMRLVELLTDTKQYSKALDLCNRLIQVDPCLEEVYRMAMNLYAWEGNRSAISQLYKGLQKGLEEYADTNPSPQTESLYLSLIN